MSDAKWTLCEGHAFDNGLVAFAEAYRREVANIENMVVSDTDFVAMAKAALAENTALATKNVTLEHLLSVHQADVGSVSW